MTTEFFFVLIGVQFEKIFVRSIVFLQVLASRKVKIKTDSRELIAEISFDQLRHKLPSNAFCQVHSSYIISMDKIVYFDEKEVHLKGATIPVERKYKQFLKQNVFILEPDAEEFLADGYFVDENGNLLRR